MEFLGTHLLVIDGFLIFQGIVPMWSFCNNVIGAFLVPSRQAPTDGFDIRFDIGGNAEAANGGIDVANLHVSSLVDSTVAGDGHKEQEAVEERLRHRVQAHVVFLAEHVVVDHADPTARRGAEKYIPEEPELGARGL